tara:strand:+ start:64 stop:528 length:465 start_codon:yes stop_codon:yes gene_type:complete
MIKKYNLIFFVVFFSVIACEKDDICIEDSENTNRINITFIDYSNKQPKSIDLNSIKGIGVDSIIEGISGTNLKLPLNVNSSKTKYLLEFNQDVDTLVIFHKTIHYYLNRSCGYISNFIVEPVTEISKDYGWIREVSIQNDSIFNEEKTNILIHF